MCTSMKEQEETRKEQQLNAWRRLVLLCRQLKRSPSVKRWGKVLWVFCKILLQVFLRKVFDQLWDPMTEAVRHWLRDL